MIPSIHTTETHFIMPGMATAHSHAFQRALRGRTQRRASAANSFWTWRGLMFKLAETLNPDDIYTIARLAYAELALSGVTAVGEFHYLNHDVGGRPYANRTETAEACIRAALDVGIRITLIRTAYMRGGYNMALTPAQQRFSDPDIDLVLQDVASLQKKFAHEPTVAVAIAPHSVRAVPLEQIKAVAAFATEQEMMFHIHVSEQRQELAESLAEYGVTPVQLMADNGILNERFVGIHATHLSDAEIKALGQSRAAVCLCRSTERDLGDGMPRVSEMVPAGAQICVGIDSHVEGNAFEEVRAIELDERSRQEARHVVAEAPFFVDVATRQGYRACGMGDTWQADEVTIRRSDAALVGYNDQYASDAVIFAASPRAVDTVSVAGKSIVEAGQHPDMYEIVANYEAMVKALAI